MADIKIFVDIKEGSHNKVAVSSINAEKLGVSVGASVEVVNPDNNMSAIGVLEISESALEFAGQISKNIIDAIQFTGIEVIIRASMAPSPTPQQAAPAYTAPAPQVASTSPSMQTPLQTPKIRVPGTGVQTSQLTPTPQPPPSLKPVTIPQPTPMPTSGPPPQLRPPSHLSAPATSMSGTTAPAPQVELDPYRNKIDVNMLKSQKKGLILTPVINNTIEGGRVQLSPNILRQLGLGQGMLVAWEDPLTRATGSARIDQAQISDTQISMSKDTKEDTNILSK